MVANGNNNVGSGTFPIPVRPDDARFVHLAARIGAVAAAHAAEHDRDATFVAESYIAMREHGYLALAVPDNFGGLGATLRQVCYAQAELAQHDSATALSAAMHVYQTLMHAYRHRTGAIDAEAVLCGVAEHGLVIATSGGSDWLWPTATAVPDGACFRVSGRKMFCSQSSAATIVSTCAVVGEPHEDAEVLHFSVPLDTDGIRIEETWNTLGMRGTASHDVVFDNVIVHTDNLVGRRRYGEFGTPLLAAAVHFAPVVSATYFGIAAAARDTAVAATVVDTQSPVRPGALPRTQRLVGLMDAKLRSAWWALIGAIDELGDDYVASPSALATVMLAKRQAVTGAIKVVDLAMDVLGGRSYFRKSSLERAYRDVRAGTFHPLTPESTLTYAGKLALGDAGITE